MTQPKYKSVMDWAKDEINKKQLKIGDQFYTENEICEMLGVSRPTVRNALSKLEEDNILVRRRGSGTFIAPRRNAKGKTIGFIASGIDEIIFPRVLKGIEEVSYQSGYNVQIAFTHEDMGLERSKLQAMADNAVDGIIVEPLNSGLYNPNEDIYKQIQSNRIPLIFLEGYYKGSIFPHVSLDHVAAGQLATEYLINAGHRKITGFFMDNYMQARLRYEGYVKALMSHSIGLTPSDIFWFYSYYFGGGVMETLRHNAAYLLKTLKNYTALMCFDDLYANSLVKLFLENGVRIPEDISVISVGDSIMAATCPVPLTSVTHPNERCGMKAAENMIKLIEAPNFNATFEFAPLITERESVKKL